MLLFLLVSILVYYCCIKITICYKKSSYKISEKDYMIKEIPYKKAGNFLPAFL